MDEKRVQVPKDTDIEKAGCEINLKQPRLKLLNKDIADVHDKTLSKMVQFLGIGDPTIVQVLGKMMDTHVQELVGHIKTKLPVDVE